jgi:hypothetical protein
MQHPFVSGLEDKTMEELQASISDLSTKLTYAMRGNQVSMVNQMQMIIESYKSEYLKRMDDMYKKQNLQNQINISK